MREFLEFKKDFPELDCFTCRKNFEMQKREPPCDKKGCVYTKDGKEPPKLTGYSAVAYRLWNLKEALGMQAVRQKLKAFTEVEKEVLIELIFQIEIEARKLGLKNFEGGI